MVGRRLFRMVKSLYTLATSESRTDTYLAGLVGAVVLAVVVGVWYLVRD
jgi:hypothetical protein